MFVTQVLDYVSDDNNKRQKGPISWYSDWINQQKTSVDHNVWLHTQHVNELPPDMDGGATSAAANHLFRVN